MKDRKIYRYTIILLITMLTIGLSYTSPAKVQDKTKRTVSKIRFHSKSITPPVEYSNLKIRGKKVKFRSMFEPGSKKSEELLTEDTEQDTVFEEDDDFWEHITVDVTNIWDKEIIFLNTYIYFYTAEGENNEKDVGAVGIELNESLKPRETKALALSQFMIDYGRARLINLRVPIVKVGIFAYVVRFADGSSWTFDGKTFPAKPKNDQSNMMNRRIEEISKVQIKFNRKKVFLRHQHSVFCHSISPLPIFPWLTIDLSLALA